MQTTSYDLVQAAFSAWTRLEGLRRQRERLKNFTYGRQWSDYTTLPNGTYITEGEAVLKTGRKPLTNNLVRQLVKSVIGRYRQLRSEGTQPRGALRECYDRNQLSELDCRALEEFLISGCAVQRVVLEYRGGSTHVRVDNVNPGRFFVNRISDPRGWDVEIIGQLHDMSLAEVIMRHAHGDPARAARISAIYSNRAGGEGVTTQFFTADSGRCRVIEVWTLEGATDISDDSPLCVGTEWRVRYLSPDGQLLDTSASPYRHGCHPYVLKLYPLTDGEVHPFVEDIVDQQKYINRLITLIDHVMATSAKGALLFPVRQKPCDVTWQDIAERWSSPDAVVPYDPRVGEPGPQQIITANNDLGAYRLLDLEMKLFDNISGVGDALMGRNVSASTGENLYEAQVRNATISLLDILDTFNAFIATRNEKMLHTIPERATAQN